MKKYVSFDFWNTFAIPNPEYANARTKFLEYNYGISREEYSAVKRTLDDYAAYHGIAVTPQVALMMIFSKKNWVITTDVHLIYNELIRLFYENPPIISNEVKESVKLLEEKGIKWGITSNTNFIGGDILSDFIFQSGFRPHILLYSDQIGYSKPSPDIFSELLCDYTIDYGVYDYALVKEDIVHIGDNAICDYNGAKDFGIDAVLIKTPQDILNAVKELVNAY